MSGALVVVPDPDQSGVVDEALRLAEHLAGDATAGERPPVRAVCFRDYVDCETVAARRPDELVRLERGAGTFERGSAGLAARVDALESVVSGDSPIAVLCASTPDGDDLAARLAGRIGGGSVTGCLLRVRAGRLVAGRPVYGDRGFGTITVEDAIPVVSLHEDGCGLPQGRPESTRRRRQTVDATGDGRIEQVARLEIPERDLSRARKIVAGGRGLGGADGFEVVDDLAEALGASVGASRPPADDGWIPHDRQIGVTGAEIDADLYVPCAISGDPYHMRAVEADHLVAINADPDAPVFDDADLGVVGDVFECGPAIAAAVRDARGDDDASTEVERDDG
jgi:electron transfer flavoprotein alpha subunit